MARRLRQISWFLTAALLGLQAQASSINKCEFLLHRKSDISQARDLVHLALTDFKNLETFFVSHEAKAPVLAWIGLDQVDGADRHRVALRFYGQSAEEPKEVQIQLETGDSFKTLKRLKLPHLLLPLMAWQRIPFSSSRFDQLIEHDFLGGTTYKLAPMKVDDLEVGITLREFPNGRLVLGTQANYTHYTYHLWADVDCAHLKEVTTNTSVQQVRTENGWLCRIPLLFAAASVGPSGFYW